MPRVGRREKVSKGTGEAGVDPYYTFRASQTHHVYVRTSGYCTWAVSLQMAATPNQLGSSFGAPGS
jgi:hypothetical protein